MDYNGCMTRDSKWQSGQVGLVVLLLMTAMLSVGVGAVARSTQDLRITRQEVESSEAFAAAESGVEFALNDLKDGILDEGSGSVDTIENIHVDYSVSQESTFDMIILDNSTISIRRNPEVGLLNIRWGYEQNCQEAPGLLVMVFDTVNYTIQKEAYRPYADGVCDRDFDGFSVAGDDGDWSGWVEIDSLSASETVVRIRSIGGNTRLSVDGGSAVLPTQYYRIRSVASRINSDEQKAIEVNMSLPTAPNVFDYVLFSGTTIVK